MDRVEGLVLFDHLLLLGPDPQAHICCPRWTQSAVLSWNGQQLQLRIGQAGENLFAGKSHELSLDVPRYYQQDEIGLYLEVDPAPSLAELTSRKSASIRR